MTHVPSSSPSPAGRQPSHAQAFVSAFEQPTYFRPAATPQTPPAPLPVTVPSAPVHAHRTAVIWILGVLLFALIALAAFYVLALGPGAAGVGLVLALIPLTIVLLGVRHIDRWEPEPRGLVVLALAWGAIAAVALTLLIDLALYGVVGPRSEEFSAVVQAPIVEEVLKGLGVFLIFVIARASFDGPVDGVVYGALVGAGFAFTENIQYFAVSLIENGGAGLTATFFMRAIMSPFAHAMFTALTGFAIGLAARRGSSKATAFSYGLVGLLGAIVLHAFWNGSAVYANFFLLYVTLQVPLFIGFILGIVALRREEARLTFARLSDYAEAGWFTPQEVTMLATRPGQRTGLAWAATLRGDRRALMAAFIKDATELAAVRQRAISGRDPHAAERERMLLARTTATRQALLAY